MGPKGGVKILCRSDLGDPNMIAKHEKIYNDHVASPFIAVERGYVCQQCKPVAQHLYLHLLCLCMLGNKTVAPPPEKAR